MGSGIYNYIRTTINLGAYDISAERSKTEDVIRHIENLMSDANKDHVNIKAFISDSAGEYAAARYAIYLLHYYYSYLLY